MQYTQEQKAHKIYLSKSTGFICFGLILSLFAVISCFVKWFNSGALIYLLLAFVCLLCLIVFLKPFLEGRRIAIVADNIILMDRFTKPIKINIPSTLYKVIVKDDKVISLRFFVDGRYIQISPVVYEGGDEISERVMTIIKKTKMDPEIVSR